MMFDTDAYQECIRALAAERKVLVECCLTSNAQTGAVSSLDAHPLPKLLEAHVPCCLNTDDPGVSNLTLSGEYLLADRIFHMGEAQMRRMQAEAVDYIFRDDLKPWLRSVLAADDNDMKGVQL